MVIDLDVRPAGGTGSGGRRTRIDVLVVALLVLALAGGAAPPAYAGDLTPVLEGDGRGITASLLTGSALYTTHGVASDGRADVWARPLQPGGPEWITKLPGTGSALWLDPSGSVLVSESGDTAVTTFLDARTGRVRWSIAELTSVRSIGAGLVGVQRGGAVQALEVTTGRLRWSAPAVVFATDDAQRLVVTVDERRRATVRAASDGRVVTGPRDLGVEWGVDTGGPFAPARVIGERLVVLGPAFLAAFRLPGLEPLWRATAGQPFDVGGCGAQLCALSPAGLAVFDPATGATRWTSERWRGVADDGVTLLDEAERAATVDLVTGRVELDLGAGRVAGGLQVVGRGEQESLVRRVSDGRVLGRVAGVPPDACIAAAEFLACRTLDARFRVWRVSAGDDPPP